MNMSSEPGSEEASRFFVQLLTLAEAMGKMEIVSLRLKKVRDFRGCKKGSVL